MLPRQMLPRQFYLITRRCSQRQFLLRPDAATNYAVLYCLIDAALRCEIDVVLPCAMSTHYYAVIYDRAGRYPEFIEHFHKLLPAARTPCGGVIHSSEETWYGSSPEETWYGSSPGLAARRAERGHNHGDWRGSVRSRGGGPR